MIRLLIFLIMICPPAAAGPWLRAKGKQFQSITVESTTDISTANPYSSVYYELGLTDRFTVGFDMGSDVLGFSSALFFARTSLWQGTGGSHVAAELAFGGMQDYAGYWAAVRPGLAWGRGISFHQGGWVVVDASYGYRPKDGRTLAKIEGTLGLRHGERFKFLLQGTAEKISGQDATFSVNPGIAYRIGKEYHLVGSIVAYNNRSTAIKIGLWREF